MSKLPAFGASAADTCPANTSPADTTAAATPRPVPAAEYIRMSTEHQQYSTANQADAIRDYAARRGYRLVRTYADEGKSGLRIEGREALRRLIDDVQAGRADFKAILVYDVSRWGRFQDADESAYYEYVCKRAGVHVAYCAEQFENDGSTQAVIFKSVKRVMAGEYSRELSGKVFKGQCRLIQLGYRQGGAAGYGLRRMLVDQQGNRKGLLKAGEHKSLQTDRVVLVPGPDDEVATVRSVYQMFTKDGKQERDIAEALQARGVPSESGRAWSRAMVRQILTNEKYVGNNVYNRISFKLKKKRVRNPPEMWVRHDGAFEPVVDPESFFVARGILQERNRRFTDDEMIEKLRRLLAVHAALSAPLIDDADGLPSSSAYRNRFGSLLSAYRLAGYTPARDYEFLQVNARLDALYPDLVASTVRQLEGAGASVSREGGTDQWLINGEYRAAMAVCRCRRTAGGSLRWLITLDSRRRPDLTVLVRMDPANEQPADYYLLPLIDVPARRLHLRESNGIYLDSYRFDTLSYLVEMAERVRIEVAA
jgi:DNA invertase Pin-like site-specific DNA recombinase